MSPPVLFVPAGLASAFIRGGSPVCKRARSATRPATYTTRYPAFKAPRACYDVSSGSSDCDAGSDASWFSSFSNMFFANADNPGMNPDGTTFRSRRPDPVAAAIDLTTVAVPIVSVTPVSASGGLIQLGVNVAGTGLAASHVSPGQFVQIALLRKRGKPVFKFAAIATPPGSPGGVFEFLVDSARTGYDVRSLRKGDVVRISPVIGRGLDYVPAAETNNLMIFIDDEQGLAAARSLVELDGFRAASGNGLVRRTSTTVFYSTPSHDKMGYGRLFSKWLVYGVNVVPIRGLSLLKYMTQRNICGEAGHLREHYALFCVARHDTLEALRRQTILLGLRTTAMQACTRETMATDVSSFDNDDTWAPPPPSHSARGSHSEEETWARWVKIRNSMKKEFERKWSASARFQRDQTQANKEKEHAWASWFGRNYEKWNQAAWDDQSWAGYRDFWGEEHTKWAGDRAWTSGGASGPRSKRAYGDNGYGWQQQNAQEYWNSSGAESTNAGGWYDKYGDSGGSWGSSSSSSGSQSSGYKQGGYRYDEWAGASSGSGGSRGYQGGAGQRKGYKQNRQQSSWQYNQGSGAGTGNAWGSSGGSSTDLDLYGVLGLKSGASKSEIKRAYRKKAMQHHPDRHGKDEQDMAHIKMKEIVAAYTVLKDESKRRKYDTTGL